MLAPTGALKVITRAHPRPKLTTPAKVWTPAGLTMFSTVNGPPLSPWFDNVTMVMMMILVGGDCHDDYHIAW